MTEEELERVINGLKSEIDGLKTAVRHLMSLTPSDPRTRVPPRPSFDSGLDAADPK